MFGLIEYPDDENEAVNLLFFTKQEEAENYKKLYAEKYPNEKMTYRIIKIQKNMCFDSGSDEINNCYYHFDPELNELNDLPILTSNDL